MTWALDYVTASDRGLVRQNNEDSAYAGPRLLALADGMGGHAAGEVASQLMIAAVSKLDDDQPDADLIAAMRQAMHEGNAAIAEEVGANPATEGMGTTLTALLFDGARAGLCHVGDSRGYLLRDGELTQITRDDTYVQSLVDEGKLTPDEASVHPQRSLILKALTGRPVEPATSIREVRLGDRYLLCSDGLSDPVSAQTIAEALAEGTPAEAAERLVSLALRSGGPDNVTLVVADVVDAATPTPSQPALSGALGDPGAEGPRPDTAAGRAAAMRPAAEQRRAVVADPGAAAGPGSGRRLVIAAVALALIAAVAVGLWGWRKLDSMYYVAAEEEAPRVLRIHHGVPGSLLGLHLSSPHQYVCLDEAGSVTLPDPAVAAEDADCHLMRMSDLNPVGRSMLAAGLPADGHEEVFGQLRRLAGQALPVCLTSAEPPAGRPGADARDGRDAPGADADRAGRDAAAARDAERVAEEAADAAARDERPRPIPGSQPGVNCREVTIP